MPVKPCRRNRGDLFVHNARPLGRGVPRAGNGTRVATKVPYWLNSRRVAGEPAGMPACSSLA
jgi:hypothetical protein